ncbi:MAG: thermonuclease family protein [Patescibacteria group bacterium]
MTNKRIITAVSLVAVALYTQWLSQPDAVHNTTAPTATPRPAPEGLVRISSVVDGDTIEIEGGSRVRYIGINTPETVHPTKAVECFGKEASDYNKKLLESGFVRLVRDITDTDKYGRLLRYIYLPDGTFVNLKLVADGYAYADTYPPDVSHAKEFIAAQSAARTAARGLWASCPVKK